MSYIYNLSDTWNSAPTTYTAIKMSVTDTASAAGSLLMDLQVGGTSKFRIEKNGSIRGDNANGVDLSVSYNTTLRSDAGLVAGATGYGFGVVSTMGFGWNSGSFGTNGTDLILVRDAADTLAQRRSTNAQAFRVYGSFTDASNYQRLAVSQSSIFTQAAGTGTQQDLSVGTSTGARVVFGTNGVIQLYGASVGNVWNFNTSGHFLAATDNTYDIGASGANRPRIVYAGAGFEAASGGTIGFSDGWFSRDAANTIAMRNSTNAQKFNIYNTYTDASNNEVGFIRWESSTLQIGTGKLGTGTAREIAFTTDYTSRWRVLPTGHFLATADNTYDIGANGANRPRDIYVGSSVVSTLLTTSTSNTTFLSASNGLFLGASRSINWRADDGAASADTILARDAANTLAQRNGVNAQTFRVYNTYTDASNYERLAFSVFASEFLIQTQSAGTGTARSLFFGSNGTRSWAINTSNHFLAVTDNTYDIGASGGSRPRNLYVATDIVAGNNVRAVNIQVGNTNSYLNSPSSGVVGIYNSAGTDFGRLQFGGTTSSFPALKRSGANIHVQLADDSGFTSVLCSQLVAHAAVTASNGTAIPAGGSTAVALKATSTANFGVFFGSGAPTLSAAKGSLYLRSDGTTTNDRMYVNTDGSTTWTAVTTVA